MKHTIILLLSLFALCVAGCSGNVSMGGRVTYSDTGEPVEFGTVSFSSPTKQSRGEINADGEYVIGTFGTKDGLPRGEYSVTVYAAKDELERDESGHVTGRISIDLIDRKYQRPETSGLTVVVDGKTKTFDIQVERAAAIKKKR
jgi:outer membrane lipoprotein SlyB